MKIGTVAVGVCLLSIGIIRGASAHAPENNLAMFGELYPFHGELKKLSEALVYYEPDDAARAADAGNPRSFQPVQDAFQKTMMAVFGPAIAGATTKPSDYQDKVSEAGRDWLAVVKTYLEAIRTLPGVFSIEVTNGEARYRESPTLPPLYADVPYQMLVLLIEGEETDALPRFHEQTVDVSLQHTIPIQTSGRGLEIVRLNIANLPKGKKTYPIRIAGPDDTMLATLPLKIKSRPSGSVSVRIVDKDTGDLTPARVGIYGETGFYRAGNAIPLYVFEHEEYERSLGDPMWPSADKRVFYSAGAFEMALPPGPHRVVVRKGIEYLVHDQTVHVEAGKKIDMTVPLDRWIDMPAKGWYSGDDYMHIRRTGENNASVMQYAKAEDIHVSNLVQMDDINNLFFMQHAWGDQGTYIEDDYVLRSGQEGPRTDVRGHVLFYNLTHSIHDHDTYYLYEDTFDIAHAMGGLGGYAHHGSGFAAEGGMSVGVPLGKVDFVEVLQGYTLKSDVWHHFLNLGFRLTPTAGSDFPYTPAAGDSLVYVYAPGPFSFDNCFAGLKSGHTFVTSGPMLEFTVDGEIPGSEITLAGPGRLAVHAVAQVNPTLDRLKRLEILQFGEVIHSVDAEAEAVSPLSIDFELEVTGSNWIAAHAIGEKSMAQTAAIYIVVDGKPTWNADALPAALDRVEQKLGALEHALQHPGNDEVLRANATRLREYIDAAREKYETIRGASEK